MPWVYYFLCIVLGGVLPFVRMDAAPGGGTKIGTATNRQDRPPDVHAPDCDAGDRGVRCPGRCRTRSIEKSIDL